MLFSIPTEGSCDLLRFLRAGGSLKKGRAVQQSEGRIHFQGRGCQSRQHNKKSILSTETLLARFITSLNPFNLDFNFF